MTPSPPFELKNVYPREPKSDGELLFYHLIWSLNFRLLLLILAKLEMSKVEAQKVAARSLFDWQWQKINAQAKSFSLPVLQGLFTGTLRVDFLIKSGATSFGARDLIPLVLLKYLSH